MELSRKIIDSIANADLITAKSDLHTALYAKAAESLRNNTQDSVARTYREENAPPSGIVIGEAELSPEQKAYRALFDRMLKKYGVKSPNELKDSKKDDFFNEVEAAWKKDPANHDEGEGE